MVMHDSTSVAFYFIGLVIAGKLLCGLVYASALGVRAFRDRLKE
jgi:hypothetical protein